MKTTQLASFGGPVDACMHRGRVVVAWQSGKDRDVRLVIGEFDPVTHARLVSLSIPLGDDVGAFPRLASAWDALWLAYREGASLGGRAVLRRDGKEAWRSPEECGGNDPVAVSTDGMLAWQRASDVMIRMSRLTVPADAWDNRRGAPTGISRVSTAGAVLVDEDRGAVPGMTRPSWAFDLVAGEHPDSGALIKASDGRELRAFAGEDAFTPRLAFDAATGTYAVVTWGRQGVRLATFTTADLMAPVPAPAPVWDTTGTEVDCGRFFDIDVSTVPREASDGQCWQAHRSGDEIRIVKGADLRLVEILRLTDDDVRLAYDATDSRYPRAWRLDVGGDGRSDARWCPRIGPVGYVETFPTAQLIRRAEGGPSTAEAFTFLIGIDAHGRHIDYGGDVGVVDAVLVTQFEPQAGRSPDGYHELHHWAIVKGRPIGLVRYEEYRDGQQARVFTFNRHAPTRSVPLSALIVHPIPAPPVEAPPPTPEPPPMPPTPPSLPSTITLRSAHGFYLCAEGGGGGVVVADRESAGPWETFSVVPGVSHGTVALRCHDGEHYLCAERGGGNALVANRTGIGPWESWTIERHGDGIALVSSYGFAVCAEDDPAGAVNVSRIAVGPWEIWTPTKVGGASGGVAVPPVGGAGGVAPRAGQLHIDGSRFLDASGYRHPFYIHGGDLISRSSRDPDGAWRMLDEVVALGADGVRSWTWLLGEPHWRERLFRGDWRVLERFVGECKARNLRLVLSQGDLWQAGASTARAWLADLAGFIRSQGPEWFDFVDGANEGWQNPHGLDPAVVASAMRALANVGPILSLTDFLQDQPWPGNSDEERHEAMLAEARRWTPPPTMVLDGHPGFSDGDGCIRRAFNFAYELRSILRPWINSEWRGTGRNVTVYNRMDRSEQLSGAAITWLTGGAYVAMSSPGVISDGTRDGHFDGGESFLDMPGFRDLAQLRVWMPVKCGGWRMVHGGDSQRGLRVFAVDNKVTRCDHAINESTGEYVAVLYAGPYHQERDATVEDFDPQLGGGRRIVKGRIQ